MDVFRQNNENNIVSEQHGDIVNIGHTAESCGYRPEDTYRFVCDTIKQTRHRIRIHRHYLSECKIETMHTDRIRTILNNMEKELIELKKIRDYIIEEYMQ